MSEIEARVQATGTSNSPHREKFPSKRSFAALVSRLDLLTIIRTEEDRKIPRGLGKYALVPILTERHGYPGFNAAGRTIDIPGHSVRFHNGSEGLVPYLDASMAIGLTYKNTLAAVAAAGQTEAGLLRIVQLQGASKPSEQQANNYESGLYGGFLWRDTLVQAWHETGAKVGVHTLELQSAENNAYWKPERADMLQKGYDDVAQRNGFVLNPASGNWTMRIEAQQ